jgi:hypothetical protein
VELLYLWFGFVEHNFEDFLIADADLILGHGHCEERFLMSFLIFMRKGIFFLKGIVFSAFGQTYPIRAADL